ncbi:RNA polymerase sigma-54 factor [Lewinella marina]|uniref:RNA polymerase sigma-54 factor n=1 Tax=Neolewinella marina TaxID=438751 RepID=A0A2G0CD06_9BACT|nr:RNA polymerase factor sigma-54 [Neolewinella marina]NJB86935.1 RNA polymerase sigma-54 factor [Neolewinella marina]PHK97869.1 RNA polymerase sigma-54 factor [Neolewinella marina]
MLGQSLKQSQLQKLSPRQIQLMQLMQLPLYELEQRVKEELERNPTLEEATPDPLDGPADHDAQETEGAKDDPFEMEELFQQYIEDDPTNYQQNGNNEDPYDAPGSYTADENSFFEYLEGQLANLEFDTPLDRTIALQIIGNLDDDGYLQRLPSAIADDLLINYDIEVEPGRIREVLRVVQSLEPPGLAARNLRECLLLQLNHKVDNGEELDDHRFADLVLAQTIIRDHFDLFSKKHYEKLRDKLEVEEDELRDALGEILKLNPKPASGLSGRAGGRAARVVVPDFLVTVVDGELRLSLTARNAPDLKINDYYQQQLAEYRRKQKESGKLTTAQKQAAGFIRQNIDSANWFIEAIQQRQQTLYSVMHAIVRYQDKFFRTGDLKTLRPMILKDIAGPTELDISTVSRVVNSKFVQTDFGTFSLREFFSEGMTNDEGEEVSTTQVKKVLAEIISAEDKRKPLNDSKLQRALKDAGYEIARRTVAKYREQLGLPVARLRKEL